MRYEPITPDTAEAIRSFQRFRRLPPIEMAALVRTAPPLATPLRERTRVLVMLGRPRTCLPGLIAFALGLGYTASPPWQRAVLGGLLCFLIAFSANLHNTYTDIEEDCRNIPGRMFVLARFGHRRLLRVLVVLDIAMAAAALPMGLAFFGCMVLAIAGLHQYSFRPLRLKTRPILGLLVFAQAVVFPFTLGLLTDPAAGIELLTDPAAWTGLFDGPALGMMAFLMFWFTAKGAFKNVPDFFGDRAAGIRTSATVFTTYRQAAGVAVVLTIAAYLSLAALVGFALAPPRLLVCLVWVLPAAWQGMRLIGAQGGAAANQVLRKDMYVSCGFVASLLLVAVPQRESFAVALVSAVVLAGTDLLRLDSRRAQDIPAPARTPRVREPEHLS